MNIPEPVDGMGNLTDGELAAKVKAGVEVAFNELTYRYFQLLQKKIIGYRNTGADADDLLQEATLGLLDAVLSFDETKAASFETFASVCIKNRLLTFYRAMTRQKNVPLNSFVSLPEELSHESATASEAGVSDPEKAMLDRESFQQMKKRIEQALSPLEFQVLSLYLDGSSYAQISHSLSVSTKAVDNALQRIRAKLKKTV